MSFAEFDDRLRAANRRRLEEIGLFQHLPSTTKGGGVGNTPVLEGKARGRKTVSIGYNHILVLLDDGSVTGWGNDDDEQISGWEKFRGPFLAVRAGFKQSVGLLATGKIVQWGWVRSDLPNIPPDRRCTYVSAWSMNGHWIAVLDDGTAVGWGGNNLYGERDGAANALPTGDRYEAASAGWFFSLGLISGGRAVGWGRDDYKQSSGAAPALPYGRFYKGVFAGAGPYAVGLLDTGEIVAWGMNGRYNLVEGAKKLNEQIKRRVVDVSAGVDHALALLDSGEVVGWGRDDDGESSGGAKALARSSGTAFIAVSAAKEFSIGVANSGEILFWGNSERIAEIQKSEKQSLERKRKRMVWKQRYRPASVVSIPI